MRPAPKVLLCASAALLVELCIAILGSSLQGIDSRGAPSPAGFGSPGQIGELLLTRFLFPFEAASFLMDYLKTRAPLWKREERADDSRWVDAKEADDAAAERWTAPRSREAAE